MAEALDRTKASANADAINGADVRVNANTIEKRLADIWREEREGADDAHAVTRAALWNVVAHTWSSDDHAWATDVLARTSTAVPQRAIVIRADPRGHADMSSWISTNCHLIGEGKEVCCEEVSIIAAGERVQDVPPLISSLLLPDMPVAVWWLGDLPEDQRAYIEELLRPADRWIVDSAQFGGPSDLDLVREIAKRTFTAPADLNWARLEEWRAATATLFDPPAMRPRLWAIRHLRLRHGAAGRTSPFGALSEALLYVAWLTSRSGREIAFDLARDEGGPGLSAVEILFDDGQTATVRRDRDRGVVVASAEEEQSIDCVTRSRARNVEGLIVHLLIRPEADRIYLQALDAACRIVGDKSLEDGGQHLSS